MSDLVLAVDPGPEQSGWAIVRSGALTPSGFKVEDWGVEFNVDFRDRLPSLLEPDVMAIEMIASYGMPVGKEVFDTCVFIGRLMERWEMLGGVSRLVYRKDVKLHLCGSPRAKDANVRQALIDLLGPPGTKKDRGPTYGIRSHAWPAIAVGVTALQCP